MDAQHERGYQLDDCRRRMHQPLCQVRCLPLPVSLRTPSRLQLVPPMPQAAPRCARFSIRPRQAPLTPTLTHPHPHPNPHPSPLATHPSPSPLTSHLSPLTSHPRRIPSPSPHDLTTHLFRLCHSPHRQAAAARPSCMSRCIHTMHARMHTRTHPYTYAYTHAYTQASSSCSTKLPCGVPAPSRQQANRVRAAEQAEV